MKIITKIVACIAIFSFLTFTSEAEAQSVTTTAEGTVLEPISLSASILDFGGDILPGSDKAVASTDASAAQFDIAGEAGQDVNTSFTLPTEMTGDQTGTAMPINFSTTDAGHAATADDQAGQTGFDPNTDQTLTLDGTSGELYIWLGGTISPADNQDADTYVADITLDVSYPSN